MAREICTITLWLKLSILHQVDKNGLSYQEQPIMVERVSFGAARTVFRQLDSQE